MNSLVIRGRKNVALPSLPTIPGDEGVGEVVEIGRRVSKVRVGDRVILSSRMQGTWRFYGVYDERKVHIVSPRLPLPEASMLSVAPSMAYRMIKDFVNVQPGDSVIQNAANSPCGQCIIQLCKHWGIKTVNVVANESKYDRVKEHLLCLGADIVCTLPEAEELSKFATSNTRPILALNCLGGRHEDLMLKMIKRGGTIVYYGGAYDIPMSKQYVRSDVKFCKFHLNEWDRKASCVCKDLMLRDIMQIMMTRKLIAPIYQPLELKNYVEALKNTSRNEAFAIYNYVFDFTLP